MGAATLLALIVPHAAHAQTQLTTLYTTGFEASEGFDSNLTGNITVTNGPNTTTFAAATGALFGQPRSRQDRYTYYSNAPATADFADSVQKAVNSTTVVNTVAASGSQSVRMIGAEQGSQSIRYVAPGSYTVGANGVFNASLDVAVANPNAAFGQWGLNLIREEPLSSTRVTTYTLGAIGFVGTRVLATNDGQNAYAAFDLSTGTLYSASYGVFNNYALTLDYSTQTISGFVNGTRIGFVALDSQFNPISGPTLTMAFRTDVSYNRIDSVAFGQGLDGTQETGYFDNLRVSGFNVAAAPEPSALALAVLPLLGLTLRRRFRCL